MVRSGQKKAKRQKKLPPDPARQFEEVVAQLIRDVGNDATACMLLATAVEEKQKRAFEKHIIAQHFPENFSPPQRQKVFESFMSWLGQAISDKTITPELDAAVHHRQSLRAVLRANKREFINKARINRKAVVKEMLLESIPVHCINPLPANSPYPRRETFVAKNQYIYNKNDWFIHRRSQPDKRLPRRRIQMLDTEELQFDLPPHESAIFRDALTNEIIAVVIRDACTSAEAVEFADTAVKQAIMTRVTIRKEDTGIMALMGYSLGARSARKFDWVHNVIRKTIPEAMEETSEGAPVLTENIESFPPEASPPSFRRRPVRLASVGVSIPTRRSTRLASKHTLPSPSISRSHSSQSRTRGRSRSPQVHTLARPGGIQIDPKKVDEDASSAFALLWNLALTILPNDVIHSFDEFLNELRPPHMDSSGTIVTDFEGRGTYTVALPNYTFKFHNAQLAPPSGACSENYPRHVHREPRQPHPYAISWSTSRQIDPSLSPLDNGGHFFIASHGIRIQGAPNTMTAWLPELWHCTSLHAGQPDPALPLEEYCSRGLAIVTAEHFTKVFREYQKGKVSLEQAEGQLYGDGDLTRGEET
ncbi:hypothetical protein NP233_g10715 [Leucocoprinus birnbaumii]|uniref:Uncharacterized protein n=1 Tax=Leucocoprinus birnbaumii TaxID=56174 RepID=A0AAD5VLG5_9AGAR|nr:hypothetical protein NP233_g10715 [Leucocoprinus birnbaumii]